MKESIASRVGRIISGGIHQLIDAFENMAPEAAMENTIREIDGAVDDVRAELGKTAANHHLAKKRLAEASQRLQDLTEKIELAVQENREDLAEAAIAQQLDIEAQLPVLETAIREFGDKERELEGYITALNARKREMKEELRAYVQTRKQAVQAGEEAAGAPDMTDIENRVARAESAFDRIMENQTGLAGKTAANLKQQSALEELEELSRRNRIKERLAAARARVKGDA